MTHELLASDICVPKAELSFLPDEQSIYMVDFDHVRQVIKSHYLKTHLRAALYKCMKVSAYKKNVAYCLPKPLTGIFWSVLSV